MPAMAATSKAFVFILIILVEVYGESHVVQSSMDFDTLPGLGYELRIPVEAGKEQCFYQFVQSGSNFYVSFQVLRGGDGKAGFAVRHPNGKHVLPYSWENEKNYEEVAEHGGVYEICADNSLSRFAAKLVNIYLIAFKHHEWEQYSKEITDLEVTVDNFTNTIDNVDQRISLMRKNQEYSKSHMARDAYLIMSNNAYVQYWSIAQCFVIVLTFSVQVYFVRKLFDSKSMTPTLKPRA
ncbi:Transmembrane emp24 domain-containing protein 6 [Nymphon striatum]|nr:Transmembrane emp24 domain-containing protein 6 [Nymphon striatum]